MLSPCSRLPAPLCLGLLIQTRLASTASSPATLSFPKHSNPTPHEIFHLPRGASQSDIKSRYYELVRIHHPDCPTARTLPSSTSHSRFQAISDAYAVLSGKKLTRNSWASDALYEEELLRRRRAQWRASASTDEFGHGAHGGSASSWEQEQREKWDQRLLVFIAIFAISSTILPISMLSPLAPSTLSDRKHEEAKKNLAEARREAREMAFVRWTSKDTGTKVVNTLEHEKDSNQ